MSVVGNNRVGIPIVVLHDAEGSVVTVETKSGFLIRGLLFEAEDQMNLYLKNAVVIDTTYTNINNTMSKSAKSNCDNGGDGADAGAGTGGNEISNKKYKRIVNQVYVRGTEIIWISIPDMLRHAPMFERIKHWRKHGGAPPEGVVGSAVGQAAAILRKAQERRGFRGGGGGGDGRGFGRGRRGGGGGDGGRFGAGHGGGGGGGGFGGGPAMMEMGRGASMGGVGGGGYGVPGQYGPR